MDNGMDHDDVPVSVQAARIAVDARRLQRMDAQGVGLTGLYFAIMKAAEKIAPVIEAATQGARGKYAKYDAVIRAVRQPLLDQGVLISHNTRPIHQVSDGVGKALMMPVITDLIHVQTGEVRSVQIDMPVPRADPQAAGSALSYGKRYTLLAALGLATGEEDDDGQAAMPGELPTKTVPDTARVAELKTEIKAAKTYDKLLEWHADGKNAKRIKALGEAEFEAVKVAFLARKQDLADAAS